MTERRIVVDKLRLTYTGIFSVVELYQLIDRWTREKGYDKRENKNVEEVKPSGKNIELDIEPWKKITDYVRSSIHMRIIMSDIKEVEVEKDNLKVKMNQGKVQIIIDGWLDTDYENRWEGHPIFFFLRSVFEKYVYKPFTVGYENYVASDVSHLHSTIKSFLNLYRYTTTHSGGFSEHRGF